MKHKMVIIAMAAFSKSREEKSCGVRLDCDTRLLSIYLSDT
jgi:hypothetical protein